MNIVSLKHDSVFREVMSYESIRKQLISDVTGIPLETIREVRLVSPFLRKLFWWQKQGILDAAMVLQDGTKVDVELQVRNQGDWMKRKLFYLAKMYTDNLRIGQDYRQLKKCICISILGFRLVEGEEYHTAYSLRDRFGRELTDLFELHIVELNKPLRDGDAMNDWIQLFNTETMEGLDMIRTKNAGVAEAVEVVRRMSLGRIVRETYESYMKAKMDRRAEDEFVRNEGRAEGRAMYILQVLKGLGDVPQVMQERILAERNLDTLDTWFEMAMNASDLREFERNINQ